MGIALKKILTKKSLIAFLSGLLLCTGLYSVDLGLHLYPAYDLTIKNFLNEKNAFSIDAGIDIAPVTIRERDKLFFSLDFTYTGIPLSNFPLQNAFDGTLGIGYKCRINDRFSAFAELRGGLWVYTQSKSFDVSSLSGLLFGARAGAEYNISPYFSAAAFARDSPHVGQFVSEGDNLGIVRRAGEPGDGEGFPLMPAFAFAHPFYDDVAFCGYQCGDSVSEFRAQRTDGNIRVFNDIMQGGCGKQFLVRGDGRDNFDGLHRMDNVREALPSATRTGVSLDRKNNGLVKN